MVELTAAQNELVTLIQNWQKAQAQIGLNLDEDTPEGAGNIGIVASFMAGNHWMGHSDEEMSTRYGKQLIEDDAWRMEWSEKAGLGFKLPESSSSIGQLRQLETEENVLAFSA